MTVSHSPLARSAALPAAALLALLGPPAAAAQEARRQHCSGDYMAHCGEHPPGGPEVEACFRAKRRLLSPACAAAIGAYERDQRALRRETQAR